MSKEGSYESFLNEDIPLTLTSDELELANAINLCNMAKKEKRVIVLWVLWYDCLIWHVYSYDSMMSNVDRAISS
jgi:hypothetical protein